MILGYFELQSLLIILLNYSLLIILQYKKLSMRFEAYVCKTVTLLTVDYYLHCYSVRLKHVQMIQMH